MNQKMAVFNLQGLLLLALLTVVSECTDDLTVVASQEDDVALPCINSTELDQKDCFRLKWKKKTPATSQIILARPESPNIPDAERVKWGDDGNGWMSLFLTKVQKSDEGQYSCEIWQGWEQVVVKGISLIVKECRILRAVRAAPGRSINMTCPLDMTSGHHGPCNISWVMLKGGNPVSIDPKRVNINGTSLAIQAVSHSDSGWYRCKYMLGETQRCFEVNLLVQEKNAVVATKIPALTTSEVILNEGSSGAVIAIVASVVIAIAINAALIGLFIYRRCNTQTVAQQIPRHSADTHMDSFDGYEIVPVKPSQDSADYDDVSVNPQGQDESLCTFHY